MTSVLNTLQGWKLCYLQSPLQSLLNGWSSQQKPFFDPGASTSQKSTGVSDVIVTSPSPVQATGEVPVMKAPQPVEAPSTRRGVVIQQNATQPVEAPGAGTANQPVETPGAGPEVLLTGTGNAALHVESTGGSDSEEDLQSDPGSPVDGNFRDGSPETSPEMIQLSRNSLRRLVTERLSKACDHLWAGIRSLSLTVFHLQMTTLLPVLESSQPGRSLLSCRWMTGYAEKWRN